MVIKNRRWRKRTWVAIMAIVLVVISPFIINQYIINYSDAYIIDENAAQDINADCILVLGAGLKPDGTPNYMLQDRLDKGVELYKAGTAPKLLLSGDNGQERYDEVNAMKDYIMKKGIPAEDIFLDHAGFSTYESMYRSKAIFQVKKAIVITQHYHQYRSLYLARGFGIEAYGIVSEPRIYIGQSFRDFREFLARNKDFFIMVVKPQPTFLGETIPISGSGLLSHD